MARESFGTGGGIALAPPPGLGRSLIKPVDGPGAAADGFSNESSTVVNSVGALAEHDAAGHSTCRRRWLRRGLRVADGLR